jgi:hypothetical protein
MRRCPAVIGRFVVLVAVTLPVYRYAYANDVSLGLAWKVTDETTASPRVPDVTDSANGSSAVDALASAGPVTVGALRIGPYGMSSGTGGIASATSGKGYLNVAFNLDAEESRDHVASDVNFEAAAGLSDKLFFSDAQGNPIANLPVSFRINTPETELSEHYIVFGTLSSARSVLQTTLSFSGVTLDSPLTPAGSNTYSLNIHDSGSDGTYLNQSTPFVEFSGVTDAQGQLSYAMTLAVSAATRASSENDYGFSQSAGEGYSELAAWGGFIGAQDFTVRSASGLDYAKAISLTVPEPSEYSILLAGLVLLRANAWRRNAARRTRSSMRQRS